MTRSQLIAAVAARTGSTAEQAEAFLDAMVDEIADTLRTGDKVTIAGFGRFEMRPRKSKAYTNPKTGEASQLEPTAIPGFKAGGRFKDRLEGKE